MCLRQQGSTTTLIEGAKQTGAVIVTGTYHQSQMLKKDHGVEAISYAQMPTYISGRCLPLVYDKHAVECIINDLLREIASRDAKLIIVEDSLSSVISILRGE